MFRFIASRVLQLPLILAVIYVVTFLLAWVAPGSPFERTDRKLPEQVLKSLKERFHAESAWSFLTFYPYQIIVHGDLGPSLGYPERTVNGIIAEKLPVSLALGATAVGIAVIGGVTIGTLAAVRRNGALDWVSLNVAMIGISVPSFVVASLLGTAFAVHWKIFPISGWPNGATTKWELRSDVSVDTVERETGAKNLRAAIEKPGFDAGAVMEKPEKFFYQRVFFWATFKNYVMHLVLPALSLSLLPMAYITRLTRVSMIDVLGSDYVRTARAKGLSKPKVVWKHCLRNAILPVISYLGPAAAGAMVGSFVIEKVFSIPGLGTFFVTSIQSRDQPLILGTVLVESALLLVINLVVDLSYGFIDPRIDVTGSGSGH